MKNDRQHKLVLIGFATTLAVILASSAIAGEYPDYAGYVIGGVLIYAALLVVASFVMKKNAA